jgi:hypothetical protein
MDVPKSSSRRAAVAFLALGALPAVLLGSFSSVASASPAPGFTPTTVVGDNNPNGSGCDDITAVTTPDQFTAVYWVTSAGAVWQALEYNDNHIYKYTEIAPDESASCNADIAAVSRASSQADVFWVGENGSVEHAAVDVTSTVSPELSQVSPAGSASTTGSLAAVSRATDTWEIFWVTPAGAVEDHYWFQSGFTGQFTLYPAGASSPSTFESRQMAVVSRNSGTMEVFWIGQDRSVQDSYFYNGQGWNHFTLSPAGSVVNPSQIAAVTRAPNTMELWWIGTASQIHGAFWFQGGAWAQYTLPGTFLYDNLAAVAPSANQMELFFDGGFDGSYQTISGPPWATPSDLPPSSYQISPFHDIAAVSLTNGITEAFVVTADGAIVEYSN